MSEKKSILDKSRAETALRQFSNSKLMEEKILGLKELMKSGAIYSVQDDPKFATAVEQAVAQIRALGDPKQKLLALIVLVRITNRIRSWRAKLNDELQDIMQVPPPDILELGDADDRYYAAQALRFASGDWVTPYLARLIVEEEAGEKARSELVKTLLVKSPNLSFAFDALSRMIADFRPATEMPGDSAARRLKRILSAIRKELLLEDRSTGDGLGETVEGLISGAFRGVGPPQSPDIAADITSEVAEFLHDLVRTRFSLAAESSTYRALTVLSRWYARGSWPDGARQSLKTLSRDIEEAIALLARQGIADDELLKCLALVQGSRKQALRTTSRIAKQINGLSSEVTEWLHRGRVADRHENLS